MSTDYFYSVSDKTCCRQYGQSHSEVSGELRRTFQCMAMMTTACIEPVVALQKVAMLMIAHAGASDSNNSTCNSWRQHMQWLATTAMKTKMVHVQAAATAAMGHGQ